MVIELPQWPYLREGDGGHAVRSVQYLLRARGYSIEVDGIFGPRTDATVRAFQRDRGLDVDGIVGPLTWGAVIIRVASGSTGDAVRAVQTELLFRHNVDGTPALEVVVDGIFGPQTDAAVRYFQELVRGSVGSFLVDGIVGPLTWQALVGPLFSD
ncbi:MAG: peptidoglycan-binding protein [Dactylosporangium sp.]|nr:peptidoglycan-binding protein [Dactylosporangium sp.]NNJ59738.1 peptidoglycan-binding protein [Dactylosporangium sp.]